MRSPKRKTPLIVVIVSADQRDRAKRTVDAGHADGYAYKIDAVRWEGYAASALGHKRLAAWFAEHLPAAKLVATATPSATAA